MWRRLLAFANLHTHRLVTLPEAIRNQVVTELVNDLVDRLRGLIKSLLPALLQSSIARTPRLGTNLLRLGIGLIAHLLCLLTELFAGQLRLTEQTLRPLLLSINCLSRTFLCFLHNRIGFILGILHDLAPQTRHLVTLPCPDGFI